jgi:hypothetical protein
MTKPTKPITEAVLISVHKMLAKTYPDVALDDVREQVESLKAGTTPMNIIGMFAEGALKRAGYL